MDPTRFVAPSVGSARRPPGQRHAFWYFDPAPVPRAVDLEPATVLALSEADGALGRLEGLGRLLTDPSLLIGPFITREALASSRIEGTRTSLAEVLRADALPDDAVQDEEVAEVAAHVRATYLGLRLIRDLPLTQRLVMEVHHELLGGGRGAERLPGELRRSPVWVGSPTDTPDTAQYVPPLPEHIPELLSDWERFVNEPPPVPVLVRAALMHYQFETIHPFLDGNGRVGRLLVGLMLQQESRLTRPLLYLSGYLEAHRREYYDRLQAVRERGELQEWLQFFLTAVRRQAEDGTSRAGALVAVRERYLNEAAAARSRVGEVIALLFVNPFTTIRRVEGSLGMTNQGARNLVRDAEARGWLEPVDARVGRQSVWVAREIFRILEATPSYLRADRFSSLDDRDTSAAGSVNTQWSGTGAESGGRSADR